MMRYGVGFFVVFVSYSSAETCIAANSFVVYDVQHNPFSPPVGKYSISIACIASIIMWWVFLSTQIHPTT